MRRVSRTMLPGRLLASLMSSASSAASAPPMRRASCLGAAKIVDCRERYLWGLRHFHDKTHQTFLEESSRAKEPLDPFALVKDEVSQVTNRLRSMVIAEVPDLNLAAGYFFRAGAEGKRICPTVLLLLASALSMEGPELRARHQRVAEITEMIHVSSLIHDDVLDDADTRRGMVSLNSAMGNKLAVLAGDFLLSRAFVAVASLNNAKVVSLLSTAINNLVTGEIMQMTITPEQRCSMEYYLQKTYYKTAALISNSCKAAALLAGQTAEVSKFAYQYGRNLGIAYQLIDDVLDFTGSSISLGKGSLSDIRQGIVTAPILFAMEEYPQLHKIVKQGFDSPSNVDLALQYLTESQGIEKTRALAAEHAKQAAEAIGALPESKDEQVLISRRALVDLTQRLIKRTK